MRYAILGLFLVLIKPLGFAAEPARWSEEIAALTKRDISVSHAGGVVFLGSSSVRLWKTLANDFEGLSCVNCGFGGSWLSDSVTYFRALVVPWHPSTIVVYAGENDLEAGRLPAQVASDFDALCREAHAALPTTRIIMMSVKPSPARWHLRRSIEETNKLLAARCAADPLCRFVDVYSEMLDASAKPRADLFGADQLHMNAAGYRLWTHILDGLLRPVARPLEPPSPVVMTTVAGPTVKAAAASAPVTFK